MPGLAAAAPPAMSSGLVWLVVAAGCVVANLGLGLAILPALRLKAAGTFLYGAAFLVALSGLGAGLGALLSGAPAGLDLPMGLSGLGLHLRIDALSAFFFAVIHLGAAAASLYAIGYGRHEHAPQRILPFYPAFIAGMGLVLLAGDAYAFLLGWEFMSFASFALVMAHDKAPGNARAGVVYIVMAAFGTLALMLAFALLAAGGTASLSVSGFAFEAMRGHTLPPVTAALVLTLALIGAGSKAGLVPLHVWLPLAHPAAPSHVSALMSGVMTKVAVYGFIRIAFDLAGPPAWWWGMPVLAIGGITAVLGVLYALLETDVKRVLASSTIENVGIIFVGLGLALAFRASGFTAAAALAVTAALFHVLNHALFKSLLFFGAGAVLGATGERRMDLLGGLIHAMPVTALAMLVGCAAISALPPLNGFVSEWLTFQAILLSPDLPAWGLKLMVPAVGALLALSAAFAAACFVRLYGVVFLGRARSVAAAQAHETDAFSRAAMLGLAVLCLLAGIFPGLVIDAIQQVTGQLVGARMTAQGSREWLSIIPVAESRSSYNGMLVFVFMLVSGFGAAFAVHRLASSAVRRAPAWDCGFPNADPVTQYTAESFAQPIRRIFARSIFGARESVTMPPPGDMAPARIVVTSRDPAWAFLFTPVMRLADKTGARFNMLRRLPIRGHLAVVFGTLVLLLAVLASWP